MSKKPLISEGVARRWAKYAGIQNESKVLLETIYEDELEEGMLDELDADTAETMVSALDKDAPTTDEGLDEADDDVLAELEAMLAEQDEELDDAEGDELEDMEDMEDMEDEEEDELDVDAEEAEADEAAMMSQEDVEAALKAGLEAMASAVADALKIKIDVRSGDEGVEPEADAEMEMDAEMGPETDAEVEEEEVMGEELYEGIDRDKLVERVMKRVAARLVKESKQK